MNGYHFDVHEATVSPLALLYREYIILMPNLLCYSLRSTNWALSSLRSGSRPLSASVLVELLT